MADVCEVCGEDIVENDQPITTGMCNACVAHQWAAEVGFEREGE